MALTNFNSASIGKLNKILAQTRKITGRFGFRLTKQVSLTTFCKIATIAFTNI